MKSVPTISRIARSAVCERLDTQKFSQSAVDELSAFVCRRLLYEQIDRSTWQRDVLQRLADRAALHANRVASSYSLSEGDLIAAGILQRPLRLPLSIEVGDSDIHENAEFTLILIGDCGSRVVHKSRPGSAEAWLGQEVASTIDGIEVPTILNHGDWHWQQYVESTTEYYRPNEADYLASFGRLLGFAQLMGLVDLHPDNVIATGSSLYIIDAETVFHAIEEKAAKHVWIGNTTVPASHTPLASSLLPVWTQALRKQPPTLLASVAGLLLNDRVGQRAEEVISKIVEAYAGFVRDSTHMRPDFPAKLVVRRANKATAAYVLLARIAAERELSGKVDSFRHELFRLLTLTRGPASLDDELEALEQGYLPRFFVTVTSQEMKLSFERNRACLQSNLEFNVEVIRRALRSVRLGSIDATAILSPNRYDLSVLGLQ